MRVRSCFYRTLSEHSLCKCARKNVEWGNNGLAEPEGWVKPN